MELDVDYLAEYDLCGSNPASFEGSVYLDIETIKTDAPKGWPQKRRWRTFMVGLGFVMDGKFCVEVLATDDEKAMMKLVAERIRGKRVVYGATREFDEMVLKGRFTNARRAHHPTPGPWPNVSNVPCSWDNIGKIMRAVGRIKRTEDIESKNAPVVWSESEDVSSVVRHNALDVLETMLADWKVQVTERFVKSIEAEFKKSV